MYSIETTVHNFIRITFPPSYTREDMSPRDFAAHEEMETSNWEAQGLKRSASLEDLERGSHATVSKQMGQISDLLVARESSMVSEYCDTSRTGRNGVKYSS